MDHCKMFREMMTRNEYLGHLDLNNSKDSITRTADVLAFVTVQDARVNEK